MKKSFLPIYSTAFLLSVSLVFGACSKDDIDNPVEPSPEQPEAQEPVAPTSPDTKAWNGDKYLDTSIRPGNNFLDYVSKLAPVTDEYYPLQTVKDVVEKGIDDEIADPQTEYMKAVNSRLSNKEASAAWLAAEEMRLSTLSRNELVKEYFFDIAKGINCEYMLSPVVIEGHLTLILQNHPLNQGGAANVFLGQQHQAETRAAKQPLPDELADIIAEAFGEDALLYTETSSFIYASTKLSVISAEDLRTKLYMFRTKFCQQNALTSSIPFRFAYGAHVLNQARTDVHIEEARSLTASLINALCERLDASEWMSKTSVEEAKKKLKNINEWYGFPKSPAESFVQELDESIESVEAFQVDQCQRYTKMIMSYLGRGFDDDIEYVSITSIIGSHINNACYIFENNSINILQCMIRPKVWKVGMNDVYNYAHLGYIIGHELCHGFDSDGSQYDEKGAWRNWWTTSDKLAYNQKVTQMTELFNTYDFGGEFVDGKFTVTENMADFGGITAALHAFTNLRRSQGYEGEYLKEEQRKFFITYATVWNFSKDRENPKLDKTDIHSPHPVRINGILPLVPEWNEIFKPEAGDKYYLNPDQRIVLW